MVKRAVQKSGGKATTDAKQDKDIKHLKKVVKRIMPEVKHITSNVNSGSSSLVAVSQDWASGFPICLNQLAQGVGNTQRIGDRVRHINLDMLYQINAVAEIGACLVRVCIIREYTTLGSNVSWSGVFQGSSNLSVINVRNQDTRNPDRYKVLYDRIHYIGSRSSSTGADFVYTEGSQSIPARIKLKLNFETDYSRGTSGSVGDIDTNGLFMGVFTNNVTSNALTMLYAFDLSYIDS